MREIQDRMQKGDENRAELYRKSMTQLIFWKKTTKKAAVSEVDGKLRWSQNSHYPQFQVPVPLNITSVLDALCKFSVDL